MYYLKVVLVNSIKVFFLMLIATPQIHADTNSLEDASGVVTEYIVGDIVYEDEAFQAEILTNTDDYIEIGLFNQEDQITAMLRWNVKTRSGQVTLNFDTEEEQTLPMSVSTNIDSENRIEMIVDGLLLMAADTTESEESEFEEDTAKNRTAIGKASSVVTTTGWLVPRDSNGTRRLFGRARYNLPDGDTHHVWVRLMAYNYSSKKWVVMKGIFANEPNNRFTYVIPDNYDLDGDDLKNANVIDIKKHLGSVHVGNQIIPADVITTTYARKYVADAWSAPNKRTNFATATITATQKEIRRYY